jgi:hypothetical protein
MKYYRSIFIGLLLMIMCAISWAQIPNTLSYQGILTDSLGNPKSDGTYSITFRLYDAESSGSVLWTEAKTLEVKRGLFTTVLADQVPFSASVKFDKPYWLSLQVASQPELSPRVPLTAVGYSLNSLKADTAQYAKTAPSQSFVDSARVAGTIPNNTVTNANIVDGTIQRADVVATFTAPYADTAVYARNIPQAKFADSARIAGSVPDNTINSVKIADGSILREDVHPVFKAPFADTADAVRTMPPVSFADSARIAGSIPNGIVTAEKIGDGQVVRSLNQLKDNVVLTAEGGATITSSGDTITIHAGTGSSDSTGIFGIQTTNNTLDILNPNGPTTTVNVKKAGIGTTQIADDAVTSAKIQNGTISFADIGQNSATNGEVIKWNGTAWTADADNVGTNTSGWTDNGTVVNLTSPGDTVALNTTSRLGKMNINGDLGLNVTSNIRFGSDETRITGLAGGDLRFVAEDLSVLTTEDITFGHFGDETWIKFDNANKRVGIGTLTPTDRLHVAQSVATAGLSAIRGVSTPTTVSNIGVSGESMSPTGFGVTGESPKYGVYGTATGNQGRGVVGEAPNPSSIGVQGIATNTSSTGVWGEGSNQGVYGFSSATTGKGVYGKVTSANGHSGYFEGGKFYVKGNAEVRDTLIADAVKIANSPRVAYEKFSEARTISTLNSWGPMDTITVEAPGPGFVMLNFSGALSTNHTYLEGTWVGVGISTSPTGGVLAQVWWEFEHQLVGGYYQSPCAVNTVATVSAAGTKKYYIVSYHWGTSAEEDVVKLYHGSFSALFIPAP